MILFSVGDQESFKNVTNKWYREGIHLCPILYFSFPCSSSFYEFLLVSYHCPNTPIVLVGCQMEHRKPKFVAQFHEKKLVPITTAQVSIMCIYKWELTLLGGRDKERNWCRCIPRV
jgi:hypothetical protein